MDTKDDRSCKQVSKLLLFLFLEITDLIFDWWFFLEIFHTLHGFHSRTTLAILAFCIVSSITFPLQLVNRYRKYIKHEILSAFVVWIEDFPQIILSLLITLCVGETVSLVQYYKVAVVVVNGLTVAVLLSNLCTECCFGNDEIIYFRVSIIIGTVIEFTLAIFVITYKHMPSNGKFLFECGLYNTSYYA